MSATIVIIEDNADSSRLAKKLLKRSEHTVHIAADGETGFDMVNEYQPDLVLMDLGLPDMDGQTVVAMLRQQADTKSTMILAFTAYPPETAQQMAEAYGCDGVITKPIDTRGFVQEIQMYVDKALAAKVNAPQAEDANEEAQASADTTKTSRTEAAKLVSEEGASAVQSTEAEQSEAENPSGASLEADTKQTETSVVTDETTSADISKKTSSIEANTDVKTED